MSRLAVRLALAFALVTAVGVSSVALLANYTVGRDVGRYLIHAQMVDSPLLADLAAYYAAQRSWTGVDTLLDSRGGMGHGMGQGHLLLLADAAGTVVYDSRGVETGTTLSAAERTEAVPINVERQPAGYVLAGMGARAELPAPAQQLLGEINRSLLQAGLIAGGLGLMLGVAISGGITRPLRRLEHAADRIAGGDLEHRLPIAGSRELSAVAHAFNGMAASLAETQQARKNLIADIAHELRTPLTVLQGNLQALMDDVYPLTKAEIAALADETQTLSRLVGDLHDLAQADAGQLSLHVGPTDLGALVTQSTALLADLAQDRALHLATAIEPNLSPVMADPDRLRQVVHNLVLNALRYTPAGGSVAVSATQQTGPNGACVRVAVQDTGPGIAPADLPHVFDRFWRGERSRARAQGGSGLGLAIARQLIEAQGGTIGVDSQPGQGSCFWFMLPAHASSASLLSAS